MSHPRVSIVIPTRNGRATLPAALDAIARQRTDFAYEVLAVDSGSTDGTVDLFRERGHRAIEVDPSTFDHGLTRNTGVAAARGEYVVLMVQDAIPASDVWLTALVAPLCRDRGLAGTYARQRPLPSASAVTRHYLEAWPGASPDGRVASLTRSEWEALTPSERLTRCTFDNVCACIRRSVWLTHAFRSTPIGEDVEWARDVLLAGYRLAYVPEAVVLHSHDRTARYEFARTYILHYQLHKLFGLRLVPTLPLLLRAITGTLALHWRLQPSPRSLALAVAWPAAQYVGALAAARGWKPRRSRTV